MNKTLRVLIIEDIEEDALRLVNEFYRGGYNPVDKRVETAEEMRKALAEEEWDLIISDFNLPEFSGPEALKLFKDKGIDIPFIMVSGAVSEETAVDSLRAGAHDFIAKSNLARFLPAVSRELKDAETRREHAKAEKALKEQELLFSTLINTMGEGAGIVDLDEKVIFANSRLDEIFGVKQGVLIGRSINDFLSPENRKIVQQQTIQRMKGVKSSYELEIIREDKDIRQVLVTASPVYNDEQDITRVFAIIHDITKSKQAEQTLRESEERFRTIANTATDAIIMIDYRGNVSYWNPAAETIFGYSYDEIIGENLHNILVPDRFIDAHKKAFPEFAKTGKGGAIGKSLEVAGIRKDGSEFLIDLSLSSIQIEGKWHAVGIIRDISGRKRFEVQLMHAQKMESIGTLAAGIAHEINTPTQFVGNNIRFLEDSFEDLSKIISMCGELIEENKRTGSNNDKLNAVSKAMEDADYEFLIEEIPKAIEQSKRGIQNVSRIVSAMRSFAHPGTEEKNLTDIHKAIESTITISRNEWKYVADLETDFDPALSVVPCYVGEFNQVILNLIVNAAHAIGQAINEKKTESGLVDDIGGSKKVDLRGKIKITTKKKTDYAEIRITDTGCGISEEIRDRLFDPFFTTKDVGKGTGQGLTLSYNVIVEKHGGEITFESEMGVGTTFVLRLPLS